MMMILFLNLFVSLLAVWCCSWLVWSGVVIVSCWSHVWNVKQKGWESGASWHTPHQEQAYSLLLSQFRDEQSELKCAEEEVSELLLLANDDCWTDGWRGIILYRFFRKILRICTLNINTNQSDLLWVCITKTQREWTKKWCFFQGGFHVRGTVPKIYVMCIHLHVV